MIEMARGRPYEGYYERHKQFIHTFFNPDNMPHHVSQKLFVPHNQLLEDESNSVASADNDEVGHMEEGDNNLEIEQG
jgi:hypothetical protein